MLGACERSVLVLACHITGQEQSPVQSLPSAARGRVLRISPERTRVQQEHVHGVAVQDDRQDLGRTPALTNFTTSFGLGHTR